VYGYEVGKSISLLTIQPNCANFDFLQYNSSAGNLTSSLRVDPILCKVLTDGKYPKKIIDSNSLEFEIWHFVISFELFLIINNNFFKAFL